MSTIFPLFKKSKEPKAWSLKQMLEETLEEIRSGDLIPENAVLILHFKKSYKDNPDRVGIDYKNVGMDFDELMSVLSQTQYLHLRDKWEMS